MKKISCIVTAILVLAACSPKTDVHGYVKDTDNPAPLKDQLVVGKTTKEQVKATFGSPSAQSTFGAETWYYITSRQETVAFLAPEITEQDVVEIQFNASGVISNVKGYNQSDGETFDIAEQTTPSAGHSMGFFEQLLGNIGRFNRPGGSDTSAPTRGGRGY